ncbi:hypothetical protein P152DRAFT_293637 [Eremomyces bilateralis CBS 781.70]|uniref:Uncharacterized protein n=1 Tax=Eremomyces bilateralis CBS 781.70 TaxID=1392243 RepID=A0A6G1G6Y0_9PEZI|nr:uncharacterized protein P152DRAFT_293637 [Eremomyces bilateralis CBS 781.70]KAF1813845.1 hypothetical protein P152DRAFT_293637 [Eremomyces bilateralis CBS 781.70]
MHHAKSHEQPSRPPPPRPDPRPYTSAYEGMNARRGSFGRSASTRVPKPGGFDPRAKQDEPPASGSAYFTQSRFSSRQQPPPPPAAKTTGFGASKSATATPTSRKSTEDPFAGGRSQHASDEAPFAEGRDRPRAPYTSQPGEKFNIFGEGMKRSSSVRASPGRAHVSSDTSDRTSREATPESRARHRSASPSARSAYNPIPTKPASQPRKKPPPPSARYSSYSSTSSEDSSGPDYPSNLGPGARHVHPGAGRSSDPETARRKSEGHATERKMASPGGFWKRGTKPNGEAGSGTMPGGPTAGAAPVPGQASSEGGTGSNKPMYDNPSLSDTHFASPSGPKFSSRPSNFPSGSFAGVYSYPASHGDPFLPPGAVQGGHQQHQQHHYHPQQTPGPPGYGPPFGVIGEERNMSQTSVNTFPGPPPRISSLENSATWPLAFGQQKPRRPSACSSFAPNQQASAQTSDKRSASRASWASRASKSSRRSESSWHNVWPFGSIKRAASRVSRNTDKQDKQNDVPDWAYPSTVLPPESAAGEGTPHAPECNTKKTRFNAYEQVGIGVDRLRTQQSASSGSSARQYADVGYRTLEDAASLSSPYLAQVFTQAARDALRADQTYPGSNQPAPRPDDYAPGFPLSKSQSKPTSNQLPSHASSQFKTPAAPMDHSSTFQSIFDFFNFSKRAPYSPASDFPEFDDNSNHNNPSVNDADNFAPNSFNIPSFSQSQSARGPADTARHARSEESINTTFSPSEWSGKFEGNPDYFAPPPTAPKVRKDSTTSAHRSPTRSRSASRPSAPGTPKPAETAQMPPPPIPPVPQSPLRTTPSGNLQFPAAPGEKRFKPELWNETKGWDFQPPDSLEKKPSSPTKGPRNGRVSEHDRRAKGPNVEDVRDEELGGGGIGIGVNANHADATPAQEEGGRASRTSSGGASVDAMDIDTEPPFMTPQPPQPQMHMPNGIARELSGSTAASPTPARAPRLVSQPTQRPDWSDVKNRTYQAYMNQVNGTSTHPTLQQSPRPTSSGFPVDQPLPPPPPGPPPSVRTSTGKKLPKSRRPPVNLADLQNVSPFTTTAGLEGLADLNTTLPFPSRPSSSHPTAPTATLPLSLPAPPRAPPPPPHLTQSSWTQYYERMGAYMGEWSNFNNTMLGHFAARQSALANVIEISKGPHRASWLGQVGDGREGGFESYMRGMKEDERVSTHWNVAKEKHREAVEEFAGVRGKVVAAFGRGVV